MAPAEWFGKRLKELRDRAGLTQKQLADKAGVGQRTVSHLEQGRDPQWATLLALASALGVECTAFTVQPAEGSGPAPVGRPKKDVSAEAPAVDATGQTPSAPASESAAVDRPAAGRRGAAKGKAPTDVESGTVSGDNAPKGKTKKRTKKGE